MTIYVVYYDYDYEGNSDPLGVFSTEAKAEEFIDKLIEKGMYRYKEKLKITSLGLDHDLDAGY